MTDVYTWPSYNILLDGGFESNGLGTYWTTAAGSPTVASANPRSGTYHLSLSDGDAVQQSITLFEAAGTAAATDYGRRVARTDHLFMYLWTRISGATDQDDTYIQLKLQDETATDKYEYDWHNGKWIATANADAGTRFHFFSESLTDTTYRQIILPKIAPLNSAGTDVDEDWELVVVLYNNSSSNSSAVLIDDVLLARWPANVVLGRSGHWTVASNGINYPVKYDPRSDTVTELSLSPPYHTLSTATDLPTTTAVATGGSLEEGKFYGFAWCFVDDDLNEASAFPFGIQGRSGFFYEQVSTSGTDTDNAIEIDFQNVEFPNTEAAKTTNNARIQRIWIWRTFGYDSSDSLVDDFQAGNLLFYYDGELDLSLSNTAGDLYTSTAADEDLAGATSVAPLVEFQRIPAPGFSTMAVYRNRIFVAGGGVYSEGSCNVENASHSVLGVNGTMTLDHTDSQPPTNWNRSVENMWFQVDGDNKKYLVEQYIYPGEEGTEGTPEELYLSEGYEGSTASAVSYRIFPRGGIVWYSEENRPYHFSAGGWFAVDGGEGDTITALIPVSNMLVVCTKTGTFLFGYEINPAENSEAVPVSRTLGCIGPHSGVDIRGIGYWLSAEGVVRYAPGGPVEVVSDEIQDMFNDPSDPDYVVRDYGTQLATDAQGVHYWPREQYLLAVKTKNSKGACDVVLVYNYFFRTWDIYRLRNELVRWFWNTDDDGNDILCFSDSWGNIHQWGSGDVDGAGEPGAHGTLAGTVTSATNLTLLDNNAEFFVAANISSNFPSGTLDLEGAYVKILAGTGVGQVRRIERNTSTILYISEPWDLNPDSTSVYEVGGIDMRLNFKFSNLGNPGRVKRLKKMAVAHKKEDVASAPLVRVYQEYLDEDLMQSDGRVNPTFATSGSGRNILDMQDAAGYNLAVSIENDGPEAPLEIRHIAMMYTLGEMD